MDIFLGIYFFALVSLGVRTTKEVIYGKERYKWYYYVMGYAISVLPVNFICLFWVILFYEILENEQKNEEKTPPQEGG